MSAPKPTSNCASQYLRDMFQGSLWETEADPWFVVLDEEFGENHIWSGKVLSKWKSMNEKERGRWLTGVLWNDRGIMPSGLCDILDLPQGSSYARGSRKVRFDFAWELPKQSQIAA